ncbi:MAG: single-stranded-DNA-specific exonuclease RecJ [Chlorobi bacterium]|nr:single-stranded-DNA-specific exonuclease RecJ [Chlorobiota bacterium]
MPEKWQLAEIDQDSIEQLKKDLGIDHDAIARMLIRRGIRTRGDAEEFYKPSLSNLHPPALLPDIEKAAERLAKALKTDELIAIVGDYDVDGITSTSVLINFLNRVNAKFVYYIPDRKVHGYGLNVESVQWALQQGASLLIAVDIGSRDFAAVNMAKAHGLDIIVLDHHETGEVLPDVYAFVNPQAPHSQYPNKRLSASAVVFKFVQFFSERFRLKKFDPYSVLDLVMLGLVADVMPLVGENRTMVVHGLRLVARYQRPAIRTLFRHFNVDITDSEGALQLDLRDIVFKISPLLNSAGRIAHARTALNLLLSNNETEASFWMDQLIRLNNERRKLTEKAVEEAIKQATKQAANDIIIVVGRDWEEGIMGIVAARIQDLFKKPVIALTDVGFGVLKGSGRSPEHVNLYDLMSPLGSEFVRFGGHANAIGITIMKDRLNVLERIRTNGSTEGTKALTIDGFLNFKDLKDEKILWFIENSAPWGEANPIPLFATSVIEDSSSEIVKEKHLRLSVSDQYGIREKVMLWEGASEVQKLRGKRFWLCYYVKKRKFNGKEYLNLYVKDYDLL